MKCRKCNHGAPRVTSSGPTYAGTGGTCQEIIRKRKKPTAAERVRGPEIHPLKEEDLRLLALSK